MDDLHSQVDTTSGTGLPGNADVTWDDRFDSDAYFQHNYGTLHDEDAAIIRIVADHFDNRFKGRTSQWGGRAIDVGAGANLYPTMTMLPFASEVVLYERANTNRVWLKEQVHAPAASWAKFWDEVRGSRETYQNIKKPMDVLAHRATVVKGNVFALRPDQFDLGTMFFVAESITNRDDEFRRATRLFIDSLVTKAPFAAAFMRDSSGYYVGGERFPACSINEKDVAEALADVAYVDTLEVVESTALREGYCGMIVATGVKK